MKSYRFKTKLWRYPGETAAWYFLTIPKKESMEIKLLVKKKTGWGSIKVKVTIGKTTWGTSIFPSKEGVYLLPVKVAVRNKAGIEEGDSVGYTVVLV